MKRAFFAITFLALPALAVAGLPDSNDVGDPGETFATETVNPMLFNATVRTIALALPCRTDCLPKAAPNGAN
jgi:hypothetical protein